MRRVCNRVIYVIFMFLMLIGIIANFTFFNIFFKGNLKALLAIPMAVILLLLLLATINLLKRCSNKQLKLILIVIVSAYLLFEIYILVAFTPSVSRDAFRVQTDLFAVAKRKLPEWSPYYKMFTQNVVPVTFYGFCYRLLSVFNLTNVQIYKVISFLLGSALYLTLLSAVRVVSKKWLPTVVVAFMLFFLPYLWMYNLFIVYTDTPLMIVWTLLTLCWYLFSQSKSPSKLVLAIWAIVIFFLAIFAQLMKASFLVSLAFAVIYLILFGINHKKFPKKLGILTATLFLAIFLSFPLGTAIEGKVRFQADPNYEYPLLHWVTMGLNRSTKGRFSIDDLDDLQPPESDPKTKNKKEPLTFLNQEQKKAIVKQRLVDRLFKKNIFYLVGQDLNKFGVLLYGGYTHTRYYDGFQQAPKWYQDHANGVIITLGLLAQSFLILLYGLAFWKIWHAFWTADFKLMPPVLVILGILSFYGLLWEANPRYAEVILGPLLIFLTLPTMMPEIKFNYQKVNKLILVGAFCLFGVITENILSEDTEKKISATDFNQSNGQIKSILTLPVLGNFSNYGVIYGRKNLEIPPHHEVVQKITVTGVNFRNFEILRKEQQRGIFSLRLAGKTLYRIAKFDPLQTWLQIIRQKPFAPGEYELVWENNHNYPITIPAQESVDYPLLPQAITGLPKGTKPNYLIFDFSS